MAVKSLQELVPGRVEGNAEWFGFANIDVDTCKVVGEEEEDETDVLMVVLFSGEEMMGDGYTVTKTKCVLDFVVVV